MIIFTNKVDSADVITELTTSLAFKEKEIAVLKTQLSNYQKKGAELEQWLDKTAPNLLEKFRKDTE